MPGDNLLNKLIFPVGDERIPYFIAGDCISARNLFIDQGYDCYFIIFDEKININELTENIFYDLNIQTIKAKIPESNKSISILNEIIEQLIDLGVTRNSCLIAAGGGVLGNIVGLASCLLYRGIDLIHIPTTIMSASDSVLSIKQAVNSKHVKNIIGSYYTPKFICTIYSLFQTLPRREYYSGIVEFVKNVLISDFKYEDFISKYDFINYHQYDQFEKLMELSIECKGRYLLNDKYERENAIIFEYGHTFGHAIEMITKGVINHGEGVAFGLLAAACVSNLLGFMEEGDAQKHRKLLSYMYPQISGITNLEPKLILLEMEKDNKRGYISYEEGTLPLVIIKNRSCTLMNVNKQVILQAITETFDLIQ